MITSYDFAKCASIEDTIPALIKELKQRALIHREFRIYNLRMLKPTQRIQLDAALKRLAPNTDVLHSNGPPPEEEVDDEQKELLRHATRSAIEHRNDESAVVIWTDVAYKLIAQNVTITRLCRALMEAASEVLGDDATRLGALAHSLAQIEADSFHARRLLPCYLLAMTTLASVVHGSERILFEPDAYQ